MPATSTSVFVDADGPVHVADFGGPHGAPTTVLVHGLAGSHVVWRPLAQELTGRHRVLAVDLPGHGRSPAAGRSPAVTGAASVLTRVLDELGLPPATLVGHSMGAAASVLAAAADPGAVERLVLLAPPVPRARLELAPPPALLPHVARCLFPPGGRLALRRRIARIGLAQHVRRGLLLTCGSLDGLEDVAVALTEELEAALVAGEDPVATFVEAARSVGLLVARRHAYREAVLAAPTDALVVHGARDRVVPAAASESVRALRPEWSAHLLEGVGHSPHLESPRLVAGLVAEFVEPVRPAAEAATASSCVA